MSLSSSAIATALALLTVAVPSAARTAPGQDKAAIDRGRALYAQHCAACHGKNGDGDGPAASAMTAKPTDITLMQRRHGAFFRAQLESAIRGTDPVVAHGVPGMMVWGALFRADARGNDAVADARIRDLIAFVETIQAKD